MTKTCCSSGREEMARWKAMPKLELHAHLNGCVRSSTLLELASEQRGSGVVSNGDIERIITKAVRLSLLSRRSGHGVKFSCPALPFTGVSQPTIQWHGAQDICSKLNQKEVDGNDAIKMDDVGNLGANRSLSDCFRLFPLIHELTTDHATVTRITKEAIEDFVADNVVYLELRTTPKCNEAYGMSKLSYVEAVLAGFEAAGVSPCFQSRTDDVSNELANRCGSARSDVQAQSHVYVRLLLSIDRRESAAAAMDTVLLAWEMRDRGVVGVDLSGNPSIGQWQTFLPALNWAKQHGLPLTLHCGEVFNAEEVRAMLALQPERLGHVCCLDEPEWNSLLESTIPVEICLTSNLCTQSVRSIFEHHFAALHKAKHPTILCTDDPGLFSTCLSHEYSLAETCFGLSEMELLIMGKNAVSYIFAEDQLKSHLEEIFERALAMLFRRQNFQVLESDVMKVEDPVQGG